MTRNSPHTSDTSLSPPTPANKTKLPTNIRLITHNIRYATRSPFKGEAPWSTRRPHLCAQLLFTSSPPSTLICLQEVLHAQLTDILAALNAASPSHDQWSSIGVGRDDGVQAGEYSPILYRPSIWKLARWETRWLSPTPDVPSKGWDASSIRIVTIGSLVHRVTGRAITLLNTHLDDQGVVARRESAQQLLASIRELSSSSKETERTPQALFLTGDFNSPPDDGAYQIMTAEGSGMEDVGLLVPGERRYGNEMTFTGFGTGKEEGEERKRIDFVFGRRGHGVRYVTYGVLANRFDDGVWLSDHRAVVTDLVVGG